MNAHTNATLNNRSLDDSLSKLSSGLRINKAADDASGMVIADSLRSQSNSLGQAIANANDAVGLIQTADKAMDEQIKILDTIKTKAIQAASDGQSADSRAAIQKDVNRLIEQLDNIAKTTSFNGQVLLSGNFSNREFQVGAYSNQTINASIGNTQSLAVGQIQTRDDIIATGNEADFTLVAALAKGATQITLSSGAAGDLTGLAIGDTIRIAGQGDFTITGVSGGAMNASNAIVTLNRGLDAAISIGGTLRVSIVNEVIEGGISVGATSDLSVAATMSLANLTGLGVGDQITITNSVGETAVRTVVSFSMGASTGTLSGQVTFSAAITFSTGAATTVQVTSRSNLGTTMTSADYVQYTVEGSVLAGVQMTSSTGAGIAGAGLGAVADQINATTDTTGVKAVANVEKNSNIRVQGMTTSSDIIINGSTVLQSGQTILAGDTDNALINAINAKKDYTGVTANLEGDGTITLTSDGRAMQVTGLSGVAGISNGTYNGTLDVTKNSLDVLNLSGAHYSNAGLTATATNAHDETEIVAKNKLSDLVFGQVDDNNDGSIDNDDKIGLLNSREGATKAMDIVESAIKALDGIRADLGSAQNQLIVTVNNISVTQVNVRAAESQIRDVDFAAESANFSKYNILAQSGSYAMSQANAVQQNVLKLLQ